MGDARHNPNSLQYRRPLSDNLISARLATQVVVSNEWKLTHPGEDESKAPPSALEVVFLIVGSWITPLATAPQNEWPGAEAPVAELYRMPILAFRRQIDLTRAAAGGTPLRPLPAEEQAPETPPEAAA